MKNAQTDTGIRGPATEHRTGGTRLRKTLIDLGIAMINATLILLAICLFLALRISMSVNDFAGTVAQNLVSVEPLREDVQAMTGELSALRGDLSSIREQSGALTSDAALTFTSRLDSFEQKIGGLRDKTDALRDRVSEVSIDPAAILDHAIAVTVAELTENAASLVGCVPSTLADPLADVPPAAN